MFQYVQPKGIPDEQFVVARNLCRSRGQPEPAVMLLLSPVSRPRQRKCLRDCRRSPESINRAIGRRLGIHRFEIGSGDRM